MGAAVLPLAAAGNRPPPLTANEGTASTGQGRQATARPQEATLGKVAFLFPGQGSQAVGMGSALVEQSAAAKAIFEAADDALGDRLDAPLSQIMREGPAEALKRTAITQPAILTMSVACHAALQERGIAPPALAAGHSLGEYSALVAAGALPFADAVRAVHARGTFMQEAVPEGEGAMAAVLGLNAEAIAKVLGEVSAPSAYVAVANYNGGGQTVIAGHAAAVEKASAALKEAGAKRVLPLPVSAPFHCELMAPVQARLREVLTGVEVSELAFPILTNVEATPNQDPSRVVDLLVEQVVAPVRFTEIAQAMLDAGVQTFVEVGPGKALIGMVKRMDRKRTYLNVEDPSSLDHVCEQLAATENP